eukprot:gene616-8120_t
MKIIIFTLLFLGLVLSQPSYKVNNLRTTPNGQTAELDLESGTGPFGKDIKKLKIDIFYETKTRVHFKITNREAKRWEVPRVIKSSTPTTSPQERDYDVSISSPFGILIKRKSDNEILFDSRGESFVYAEQFLTITNKVQSQNPNIYGLGERISNFRLNTDNKYYSMWPIDRYTFDLKNLYSSHPFYIEKRKSTAYGVFLLNSNAQNVHLNKNKIKYNTIGGVLDFYVFTGPTPDSVLTQYQEVIGKPHLPAYWTLGWHQCRYGYKSLQETKEVWENYAKHKIPLDTMWNDIDYMEAYKLYTWDPVKYPMKEVRKWVDELHAGGQRYVVIVDPGVKVEPGYEVYERGIREKLYITHPDGKTPMVGKVWPGFTVFPDFSKSATDVYWYDLVKKFYDDVPVDGWWIDMNEIASFCDGSCGPFNNKTQKRNNNLNNPPYVPTLDHKLYHKTLYPDALTSLGPQYDTHSIYGYLETISTHKALVKVTKKRPFIITRSSFPGTGTMAGKWSGDNFSTWEDLFHSISSILTFNVFGIPFVGADICGFWLDANEELCVRWHQLGSFYPFARNHNSIGKRSQEPFAFGPLLIETTRSALLNRYSLLPYYYTLFHDVHVNGGTVIKSIPFEFNTDDNEHINHIDKQFLIGSGLLVSPVLEKGATSINAYLPPSEIWYDYWTGAEHQQKGWVKIPVNIKSVPVHIRGGHVIPRQEPGLTTKESRKKPFFLNVALDKDGVSTGDLYLDDGDSLDSVSNKKYTHITFRADNNKLATIVNHLGYETSHLKINRVVVHGVKSNICKVEINGNAVSTFTYDSNTKLLDVKMSIAVSGRNVISWDSNFDSNAQIENNPQQITEAVTQHDKNEARYIDVPVMTEIIPIVYKLPVPVDNKIPHVNKTIGPNKLKQENKSNESPTK